MNWKDTVVPEEEQWMPFYFEEDVTKIENEHAKAPFVPLTIDVVQKLIPFLELKESDVLLDLGCGDGRILIESLLQTECQKAYGIDIDESAIEQSHEHYKQSQLKKDIHFVCGDFFTTTEIPWKDISVVVMYLLPCVLDELYPLLQKHLSHCRIICVCFKISSHLPYSIVRSTNFPDFYELKIEPINSLNE